MSSAISSSSFLWVSQSAAERAVFDRNASAADYTLDRQTGQKSYIGVVRSPNRAPYLRTYADGKWNDNLAALVACGANCSVMG